MESGKGRWDTLAGSVPCLTEAEAEETFRHDRNQALLFELGRKKVLFEIKTEAKIASGFVIWGRAFMARLLLIQSFSCCLFTTK